MTFLNFLFSKAFLKQLGFAALVVLGLSFLFLGWLKMSTNHGQKIEVPNLSKKTTEEALSLLEDLDLTIAVMDTTNYNPDFPQYTIIEQIPKAGSFVKEDRKIYVSVNRSGFPMIEIPPVVGKTLRQAEPTLLALGFKIGKKTYRKYIAKDEVLELRHNGEKIKPGEKLQKTKVIDLVLGDGDGGLLEEPAESSPLNENKNLEDEGEF